jgi:hypothetical protein
MQTLFVPQHTNQRYDRMPVGDGSEYARTILYIPVSGIVAGEIWDVHAMVHATNNDLRSRGYGFALTTEIRCGYDSSHERDGFSLADDSGSFNVGVEAHHGLINRRALYEWPHDEPNTRFVKFIVWASSTQAQGSDDCELTPNRSTLSMLRHIPD